MKQIYNSMGDNDLEVDGGTQEETCPHRLV